MQSLMHNIYMESLKKLKLFHKRNTKNTINITYI